MTPVVKFWIGAALLLAAGLSGCIQPPIPVVPEETRTPNPVAEVDDLAADLEKGRQNQLDVLAPSLFEAASEALAGARRDLEKGAPLKEVEGRLVNGRTQLRQARENAQIARTILAETIRARDQARQAGAETLGKDYQKTEENFLELTRAIEGNNLNKAQQKKTEVTRAFDQLELAAIKTRFLGTSRELIATAEREGAARLAPESLKEARLQLETAEAFITGNRYQNSQIERQAETSEFFANRLLQITRQSSGYQALHPEAIALGMERMLFRISDELGAGDQRNRSFESQSENLAALAGQTRERNSYLEKTLKERTSALENLTKKEKSIREQWQTEKRFNEAFAEIQGLFHPAEAEVSKQGTALVIRLKTIQFPSGKSFLLPENFELLSRVQKSIGLFENPRVMVEGHTDSTGSQQVNDKISLERAEAVQEYLVANRTVTPERIAAKGFGSSRPIASNETPQGRAVNRRIDVIIQPSFPPAPKG
ncbi:MAG: OmpA family protein [Deltaproteobacteria bacterium]|nr:OmpA family protein [Deltaproteobacteria bacterium]